MPSLFAQAADENLFVREKESMDAKIPSLVRKRSCSIEVPIAQWNFDGPRESGRYACCQWRPRSSSSFINMNNDNREIPIAQWLLTVQENLDELPMYATRRYK